MAERIVRVTESRRITEGDITYRDAEDLLRGAINEAVGGDGTYVWIRDLTDEWVAYEIEGNDTPGTFKVGYTIDDATNVVTLTGEPEQVLLKTSYETVGAATENHVREARVVVEGRVLEAKGADADGNRVFACQIIESGLSKNGRLYPEPVLHAAVDLYEGAKAFDHHRTETELRTGGTAGLVGQWRDVAAVPGGLVGDLVLLPSATHVAEALDASVAAAASGMPPLVGISHDVQISERPATVGGARVMEATSIKGVLSADVVSEPAAGGRATRVVAGGIDPGAATPPPTPTPSQEGTTTMTLKELLAKLREATTDEARDALLQEHAAILTDAGLTKDDILPAADDTTVADATTETAPADDDKELVGAAHATESTMGGLLIAQAVTNAGLDPAKFSPVIAADLGKRFTEATLQAAIERTKRVAESLEVPGLAPTVGHVRVTEENLDKKRARIDATLERRWQEGYTGIQEMFVDVMGLGASAMYGSGDDLAARIVREAWAGPMVGRASESLDSTSFGQILADAMGRRMVAEYAREALTTWRLIATTAPVRDFRSQKLVRMGGYGTLPTVGQGAPYQPLTSPGDEEATYSVTKKGGTEDFTYEMAKNDDIAALARIPSALARAAAITIYRAVWDLLSTNPTIYDSVALFDNAHANTGTSLTLNDSSLSTVRRKMREQAAYGDSVDILGLKPRVLAVPPELEDIAFKLANSAVAIPSTAAGPSNTPNLHQGITAVVVDYWTEADEWFAIADPGDCPGIEVGFLDGKETPELFVQDDPTSGSQFSSDKVTWKIRHIYGLSVVDYRAFQRGMTS